MSSSGPARPVRVLQLQLNGCWDSKLFKLKTGMSSVCVCESLCVWERDRERETERGGRSN